MSNNMKPSGIEWIGYIPSDWEVIRLKFLLETPLLYGANEAGISYEEKIPRYIRITDITSDGNLKKDELLSLDWKTAKPYILKNEDILFARSGATVGKTFFFESRYGISAFAGYLIKASIRYDEYCPKFIYYYTLNYTYEIWKTFVFTQATIQNIAADKYANCPIICPSLSEQRSIAAFLDTQCSKIDNIITELEQQIEILKQYKTSLITETVTKGLNKNAPMKNSGIDCIGKIPAHWEVGRIKYCYDIILGKMLQLVQEHNKDREIYYMCAVNMTWDGINLTTLKKMWFSPSEIKMYLLQKGDLLVTEGGDVAVACIWNNELQECCIQNALHLIKNNGKHLNKFLYYWLYFLKHTGYIDLVCNKATITHFTKEKFGESPFCAIPIEEQKAISNFLDEKLLSINQIIKEKQQSIDTMKAYKKSLIYEYVTGKKRINVK